MTVTKIRADARTLGNRYEHDPWRLARERGVHVRRDAFAEVDQLYLAPSPGASV